MVCERIRSEGKEVFLFGCKHSSDSEQLHSIRKAIEKFNPDIVLVEGNWDKATFDSVEDATKIGREQGFIVFISKEKSIIVESNDPHFEAEKKFVENKYNLETSELYFLLRQLSPTTIQEEIEKIKVLLKEILKEDFEETKNYSDYFNPTHSINLLNEVTKELNIFRDEFMIRKIGDLLKQYSKIFVIKGDYHLNSNLEKIREIINGS